MAQAPSAATNFLSPEDYELLIRQGQGQIAAGQQMAQAPRHWTQALASALSQGMGAYRQDMARDENRAAQADANAQIAALLQGNGDIAAAMANPRSAQFAQQYQMSAPQRERDAARFAREKSQWGTEDKLNTLKMRKFESELARQEQSRALDRAMMERFGISPDGTTQGVTPSRFNFTGRPEKTGMAAQFDKLAPSQQTQVLAALQKKDYGEAARIMGSATRLQELGIDPDSPEGQAFLLTGKLPAKAFDAMQARAKRDQSGGNIAAGLRDVQQKAEEADRAGSLESSIGPFQGSEPDSLLGAIPINIARAWGEVTNWFEGGTSAPTEVRANIQGATEAIAAAIKPLIRGPGEGPWTDADQRRLVSVVGNLPQARNLEEFKRRLNAVRDRVQANFGMTIPFDAFDKKSSANKSTEPTRRRWTPGKGLE